MRTVSMCGWRVALLFIPLLVRFPAPASGLSDGHQLFQYRVSWNGIPAASARVMLAEDRQPEATGTFVWAEIRTNTFVDLFWSFRAQSWAEVDATSLRSRFFEYDRRINGRPEVTHVEPEGDGLLVGRYARPGRYDLIEVNGAEMLDPVAAVLRARRALPAVGESSAYDVFTGEARYRIELQRRPSEKISVPAGRFTAARIEPTVWKLDRNVRDPRVRHITLWVTDTPPHMLLRVRSEVFIGAVYVDLTGWSRPAASSPSESLAESDANLQ